jgi:hypothetical protein
MVKVIFKLKEPDEGIQSEPVIYFDYYRKNFKIIHTNPYLCKLYLSINYIIRSIFNNLFGFIDIGLTYSST